MAFGPVFADRLSGFLALTILGMVFAAAGYTRLPDRRIILIPMAVFGLILMLTWCVRQERLFRMGLRLTGLARFQALSRFALKFSGTLDQYVKNPPLMAKAMALSFCFQFVVICCIFVLAKALRLDVPFLYFLVFVPVISFVEALPISIYGLGVRDAAYVFFFTQAGVSEPAAASMALLYVVFTVGYSLQGGILFWRRAGARRED